MSQNQDTKSRKRPRTNIEGSEEDTGTPVPRTPGTPDEIQKHLDLWFDDGNVVLVAMDNTGFRLHRSILARHSVIFRDMFGIPQPICAEAFDGCPVVRLQDSSEDLGYLLSALYDGRKKFVITRFPCSYGSLTGLYFQARTSIAGSV